MKYIKKGYQGQDSIGNAFSATRKITTTTTTTTTTYCNWAFTRWQQSYASTNKNKNTQNDYNNKITTKHQNNTKQQKTTKQENNTKQ